MVLDLSKYRGRQSASVNSGGSSYDRVIPDNDHDPTRNANDWNDPMGAISEAAQSAGGALRDGFINVIKQLTGVDLTEFFTWIDDLFAGLLGELPTPEEAWAAVIAAFLDPLSGIADAITKAFQGVALVSPDAVVQNVWDSVTGLLGIGRDAQSTADLALGILLGNVGTGLGTSGSDPFDGPALTHPGPNYQVVTWGSAANQYYRNGAGKLAFQTGGFLGNWCIYQRFDIAFVGYATTTGLYVPQAIPSGARLLLLNRWNRSTFEGYGAVVTDIGIQPVWIENPSGTPIFHNLGSSWGYTQSNGEYWELDVGDVASGVMTNEYMLRVRRNGTEVASADDSSAMTYPAAGAHTGIAYGGASGSGTFTFNWAPTVETASYYERL